MKIAGHETHPAIAPDEAPIPALGMWAWHGRDAVLLAWPAPDECDAADWAVTYADDRSERGRCTLAEFPAVVDRHCPDRRHGVWEFFGARSTPEDCRYTRRGNVYFVQPEGGGPIKIGFTRGPVSHRLRAISPTHPEPLRVLLTYPAWDREERELHRAFDLYRKRGEWFEAGEYLLRYIDAKRREIAEATP